MPENLKATSLTRCWVLKKDNSKLTFYSRDKRSRKSRPDITVGIARFKKMLHAGALKNAWTIAIIYENKPNGKEVDRVDPSDHYTG